METGIPQKKTPEEIAKWREEHRDELLKAQKGHTFALNADGSVMDLENVDESEMEAQREAREDMRS